MLVAVPAQHGAGIGVGIAVMFAGFSVLHHKAV
jgi:hypothetical protein